MTRNEAHCSDDYPQGRGRSLPEPPRAEAIEPTLCDRDLIGCGECGRVTDVENSYRVGGRKGILVCEACHAKADEKPTNENLNQGGTE